MNDLFGGLAALTLGNMQGQLLPVVAPRFADDDSAVLDDPFAKMFPPTLFEFTTPERAVRSLQPAPISPREWTRMASRSQLMPERKVLDAPQQRGMRTISPENNADSDRMSEAPDLPIDAALPQSGMPPPERSLKLPPPLLPARQGRDEASAVTDEMPDAYSEPQARMQEMDVVSTTGRPVSPSPEASTDKSPSIPLPLIDPSAATGDAIQPSDQEAERQQFLSESGPQKTQAPDQRRDTVLQQRSKSASNVPQQQSPPAPLSHRRIDRTVRRVPPSLVAQAGQPGSESAVEGALSSGAVDEGRDSLDSGADGEQGNRPPDRITAKQAAIESAAPENSVNTKSFSPKLAPEQRERTSQTERQTVSEAMSESQRLRDMRRLPPPLVPDALRGEKTEDDSVASRADTPAATQSTRQDRQEPAIEIRIGRVEVRASRPQPQQQRPVPRPAPALSLGDYLRRRRDGR